MNICAFLTEPEPPSARNLVFVLHAYTSGCVLNTRAAVRVGGTKGDRLQGVMVAVRRSR